MPAKRSTCTLSDEGAPLAIAFACSTCGRKDLPRAGDWDPPICLERDAVINEDALRADDDSDADG